MIFAVLVRIVKSGGEMSATSRALNESHRQMRIERLERQMNGYFK